MKTFNLVINYVQGTCAMTYNVPQIVAKDLEQATVIAEHMVTKIVAGVTHTSLGSVNSVTDVPGL